MPSNLNIVKVTKPQEENKNILHKNTNEPNEMEQSQTQEAVTENFTENSNLSANEHAARRGRLNLKTVDHIETYPIVQEQKRLQRRLL